MEHLSRSLFGQNNKQIISNYYVISNSNRLFYSELTASVNYELKNARDICEIPDKTHTSDIGVIAKIALEIFGHVSL